MNESGAGAARARRDRLLTGLAGLAVAALCAPSAWRIASGFSGALAAALVLLLLETVYVLVVCAGVGLRPARRATGTLAAVALGLPVLAGAAAALLAGAGLTGLVRAQPAIAAAAVFAWGTARAASRLCRRPASAATLALLVVAALLASLLPATHVVRLTQASPRTTELILSLSPVAAVAGASGIDLVRSERFYEAIPLSGYRFEYPRPTIAPLPLAGLGLLLGLARAPRRRPGARSRRPVRPSTKEAFR